MPDIKLLDASDPPDSFPGMDTLLPEPHGLIAVGGDLSEARLLAAYERGIFPWYQQGEPVLWWSPDPRAVLFPNELHISRSLRRSIRRNTFSVSIDNAFDKVIASCGDTRSETGTWLTPEMVQAYIALHKSGHAHSIEIWDDNDLVGGLYGINLGQIFFGESMYSLRRNASKIALTRLVAFCRESEVRLIDCQIPSGHLASLGSRQIPRREFLDLVQRYTRFSTPSGWKQSRQNTSDCCL